MELLVRDLSVLLQRLLLASRQLGDVDAGVGHGLEGGGCERQRCSRKNNEITKILSLKAIPSAVSLWIDCW